MRTHALGIAVGVIGMVVLAGGCYRDQAEKAAQSAEQSAGRAENAAHRAENAASRVEAAAQKAEAAADRVESHGLKGLRK